MRQKTDHTRSICANLLTLISIVPALDPVPAKCIISSCNVFIVSTLEINIYSFLLSQTHLVDVIFFT